MITISCFLDLKVKVSSTFFGSRRIEKVTDVEFWDPFYGFRCMDSEDFSLATNYRPSNPVLPFCDLLLYRQFSGSIKKVVEIESRNCVVIWFNSLIHCVSFEVLCK